MHIWSDRSQTGCMAATNGSSHANDACIAAGRRVSTSATDSTRSGSSAVSKVRRTQRPQRHHGVVKRASSRPSGAFR